MIVVLDNYDSFTYNLVQALGTLGADLLVRRSDEVDVATLEAMAPDGVVMSPGPGRPEEAGCCIEVIGALGDHTPILGVCLGHQAIGAAFGGRVVRAPEVVHGKTSAVHHRADGLFRGLPDPLEATRYHSLVVAAEGLPDELEVNAWADDGLVMGIRHRSWPLHGVQFHPESIATPEGPTLLRNFVDLLGHEGVSPC